MFKVLNILAQHRIVHEAFLLIIARSPKPINMSTQPLTRFDLRKQCLPDGLHRAAECANSMQMSLNHQINLARFYSHMT